MPGFCDYFVAIWRKHISLMFFTAATVLYNSWDLPTRMNLCGYIPCIPENLCIYGSIMEHIIRIFGVPLNMLGFYIAARLRVAQFHKKLQLRVREIASSTSPKKNLNSCVAQWQEAPCSAYSQRFDSTRGQPSHPYPSEWANWSQRSLRIWTADLVHRVLPQVNG